MRFELLGAAVGSIVLLRRSGSRCLPPEADCSNFDRLTARSNGRDGRARRASGQGRPERAYGQA